MRSIAPRLICQSTPVYAIIAPMPPPSEQTSTPLGALHTLIVDLFGAEEFRRWLRHGPDADIVPELPGELAADAVVVDKALEALGRRGRIDTAFFARLTAARPRKSDAIAAVAVLWGEPSRAPAEPSSNATWRDPGALLSAAIISVPVVKYALGVTGATAVVAITTRGFGLDPGTATVGTLVVFAFMALLLVLAVAARQRHMLRVPALALTWSFLLMIAGACGLLISSFFFQIPQGSRCLLYNDCTVEIEPRGSGVNSYRGTLRDRRNGQAVAGAKAFLAGTSCTSITDDVGGFDFSQCADTRIAALQRPRIHIAFQATASQNKGWWDCRDIPILEPPALTEIVFDPDGCTTKPSIPGSAPVAEKPPAEVHPGCAHGEILCEGDTAKTCDGMGGYSSEEACANTCVPGLGCKPQSPPILKTRTSSG